MANLNINDIFWLEVISLVKDTRDENIAVGMAIRWFRYAQEKHKHGKLVSEEEFTDNGFTDALAPKFAKRVDGGWQCVGAEKHFSWLKTKSESGAEGGRASAESRRRKNGTAVPDGASNSNTSEANRSTPKQTEAAEPIPILIPIHNSSGIHLRERGAHASFNPVFSSPEALRMAVPLITGEQFAKWYPDPTWLNRQYEMAYSRAMSDPVKAPRTHGAWMKYLHTWLEIGWRTHQKLGPIRKSLDDLNLSERGPA